MYSYEALCALPIMAVLLWITFFPNGLGISRQTRESLSNIWALLVLAPLAVILLGILLLIAWVSVFPPH